MAVGLSVYGDLTPRSAAFIQRDLLKRAQPYLVFEKFGQAKPLPKNETKSMKFRRYERILKDTTALVEGVTPDAVKMTYTDVTATIVQYGQAA